MENERWSFSKKYTKIWYFLQTFWKVVFSERAALGHDFCRIIWKNGIFFPKTWYFFFGWKARDDPSQEIHGNMIFPVYTTCGCYKGGATPLCQKKNQRWSYRAKIHLKVIDVLDWHSRKRSAILCAFTETFTGVFMYCCPAKKNQET